VLQIQFERGLPSLKTGILWGWTECIVRHSTKSTWITFGGSTAMFKSFFTLLKFGLCASMFLEQIAARRPFPASRRALRLRTFQTRPQGVLLRPQTATSTSPHALRNTTQFWSSSDIGRKHTFQHNTAENTRRGFQRKMIVASALGVIKEGKQ
jgi:hypothetical protein